ncbi:TetR/AcrR family transcriptional regulator [Methylophilus sp. QUAN]|uniref:TetR/AcrR family transcriptional regulator n=1 Tax=Methylophilus sp. QUAN TaxID=2781020 RepID=UPI0018906D69|nr:TetR/AcrR family transcriptional regulator [Methylophilus sp. QUAN]MBF4990483.1 TetR/AcrR family transcriptional regulator [Methylophilus sp. QUAN]
MTADTLAKKRGRPVAFDYETALQNAMHAFWQHGYEGTSMSTLMAAMDMNKASIYAAYGSKEALFKKALERYVQGPASFLAASLAQPTAVAVVQLMLSQAAQMLTDQSHPAGCLVTQGALACSEESADIKTLLGGYRQALELQLAQRFTRAVSEQDLLATTGPVVLAKLVMTVHQGMVVQAVGGATQAELFNVAAMTTQLIARVYTTTGQVK